MIPRRAPALLGAFLLPFFAAAACSSDGDAGGAGVVREVEPLTAKELEKGVGPVHSVTLAASVDAGLATEGERVFRSRCVACHRMADRSVGPPLGDVATRRSPEFVMNMILNPAEMVERHPEARALKDRFVTPMPDQGLTHEEARAVLEYLRKESRSLPTASR